MTMENIKQARIDKEIETLFKKWDKIIECMEKYGEGWTEAQKEECREECRNINRRINELIKML